MNPDRRPFLFIGSLSNQEITESNPTGLNINWLNAVPGWLGTLVHKEAQRIMISDPAGWTAPSGQVRFAHWLTLTQAQRNEMTLFLPQLVAQGKDPYLYFGRLISPPDTLDFDQHELPVAGDVEQLEAVRASLVPYSELGVLGFGIDAGAVLDSAAWGALRQMIRITTWRQWIAVEAIPSLPDGGPDMRRMLREPGICLWNYLSKPLNNPRWLDPRWRFDPSLTEVHCLLTSAESQVPGRVAALEEAGYIVGCRNTWWR